MNKTFKLATLISAADVLLWICMSVIGSGHFYTAINSTTVDGIFSILGPAWGAIHYPVEQVFLPYLIEYTPSHGGGWPAFFATITYVALCALQVFIIVVFLGWLIGFLKYGKKYESSNKRFSADSAVNPASLTKRT